MCTPSPLYSSLTCPDTADQGGRDAVFISPISGEPSGIAYLFDLFARKFTWRRSVSAAFYAIQHVFLLCAGYKVGRVYASRGVAGVAEHQFVWNGADQQCVRQSMGANDWSSFSTTTDNAVTTEGFCSTPKPAFMRFSFSNFFPKANCNSDFSLLTNAVSSTLWRAVSSGFGSMRRYCEGGTARRAYFVYHKMENTHVYAN